MADAYFRDPDDEGRWAYLGEAVINPCARPDCNEPSTQTFQAGGPVGAFEVVAGLLIESGDTVRLCDRHAAALRDECWARGDCKPPRDL